MGLLDLPEELIAKVVDCLSLTDRARLEAVSKTCLVASLMSVEAVELKILPSRDARGLSPWLNKLSKESASSLKVLRIEGGPFLTLKGTSLTFLTDFLTPACMHRHILLSFTLAQDLYSNSHADLCIVKIAWEGGSSISRYRSYCMGSKFAGMVHFAYSSAVCIATHWKRQTWLYWLR